MKYVLAVLVAVAAYAFVMEFAKYGYVKGYDSGCADGLLKVSMETGLKLPQLANFCQARSQAIWKYRND